MRSSAKMNCVSCKYAFLNIFVEPCCNCNEGSEFKPKTNYDHIISKTPKELAEWLWFKVGKCPPFNVCPSQCIPCEAKDCWLDWLEEESGES